MRTAGQSQAKFMAKGIKLLKTFAIVYHRLIETARPMRMAATWSADANLEISIENSKPAGCDLQQKL